LQRRKTRTKPLELGAAVAVALCLSGCGGAKRAAPHPPTFPRTLAATLARQSDAVAGALESGDSCRALALARRLQRETIAAINGRRVSGSLQEDLTGAVNDLTARLTCVPLSPPPAEAGKKHGRREHDRHGKKHEGDE
jgi:hypothetical protein